MVSVFTCHTWNGVFWKRCVFKINHFWNCFRKRLFSSVFWPFKEHDTRKCIEKRRGKERVWRWLNFHLSLIQGHRDSFENQIWAGFGFMVDSFSRKRSTMENPRCMSQFQNKFNFTWDEKWGRKCIVNHFIYPLILKFKPFMITWLPRSTENMCCRVLSRAILRGRRPKSALKKPKSNMIRFHGLRMKVTWPCHSFASSKQHVSCTPFHCLVKADSI